LSERVETGKIKMERTPDGKYKCPFCDYTHELSGPVASHIYARHPEKFQQKQKTLNSFVKKSTGGEDYRQYIISPNELPEYIEQKDELSYITKVVEIRPVLVKGPAGIGKSLLAKTIAAKLGVPTFTVNCHNYTRASALLGKWILVNSHTEWVDGPITKAFRAANKTGAAMLIIEEVNAMKPGVSIVLHSLLDFRKELTLDEKDGEVIRLKPGAKLYIVSTMNPGYEGTYHLNPAFKSRFAEVELDYPPKDVEITIIERVAKIDHSTAAIIADICEVLREAFKRGEIADAPSPREAVMCGDIYRVTKSLKVAVELAIVNKCAETDEEKQLIYELITVKRGISLG